jgi:hypothetical protein
MPLVAFFYAGVVAVVYWIIKKGFIKLKPQPLKISLL